MRSAGRERKPQSKITARGGRGGHPWERTEARASARRPGSASTEVAGEASARSRRRLRVRGDAGPRDRRVVGTAFVVRRGQEDERGQAGGQGQREKRKGGLSKGTTVRCGASRWPRSVIAGSHQAKISFVQSPRNSARPGRPRREDARPAPSPRSGPPQEKQRGEQQEDREADRPLVREEASGDEGKTRPARATASEVAPSGSGRRGRRPTSRKRTPWTRAATGSCRTFQNG